MYGNKDDLAITTILDKILNDRAYKITLNPKCDGYQRGIASMLYIFFDKKIGSVKKKK